MPDRPALNKIDPKDPISPALKENPLLIIPEEDYQSFQSIVFDKDADRSYDRLVFDEVNGFYEANGYLTKWLGAEAPKEVFHFYHKIADELWKDGLDPGDYRLNLLQKALDDAYVANDINRLASLDFQVTFSFFLLSHHMAYGKINPRRLDSLWFVDEREMKVFTSDELLKIKDQKDLEAFFEKIRPEHEQYERLKNKLEDLTYKKISKGERPMLDFSLDKNLMPGDQGAKVAEVRKRLLYEYPSLSEPKNPELFDEELYRAVITFQKSFGLDADGIVGPETMRYLRRPIERDTDRIRINMERIRWMPREFGDRYIVINIPDYSLRVFERGKEALNMKVIVGQVMNKTPVFSDTLEYIVFSPTWVIPQSIKVKEMLPKLKEDSSYFSDRDYIFYESWTSTEEVDPREIDWSEVDSANFKYNVVQQPGPKNALGKVKFIMPNDLYIYLHDTPADHLFSKKERNFSHGCIRVEKPMELAEHLLKGQSLFPGVKVWRLSQKDEPEKVPLKNQYHVQIIYRTAWVDERGTLQQRKDIYQLDEVQLQLLK